MKSMSSLFTPQFIRFILAGGVAAIANFVSRLLFNQWVTYEQAIILAYLVGMLVAFILMRKHVFTNSIKKTLLSQAAKFIGINILAVLQTLIISLVLSRWIFPAWGISSHGETLAHFIGILVPIISSYFGHKLFTFK